MAFINSDSRLLAELDYGQGTVVFAVRAYLQAVSLSRPVISHARRRFPLLFQRA